MNKLEQEIQERASEFEWDIQDTFKEGAQFILEKNLDEQFAEYLTANYYKVRNGWLLNYESIDRPVRNIKDIKSYWINNEYGH